MIAICIATFKRSDGLQNLLLSLFEQERIPGHEIAIIIVDNDSNSSALSQVTALSKRAPFPIHYLTESRRGIPNARNAAIKKALGFGASHLCFIDDDMVAEPHWLRSLVMAYDDFSADVVYGSNIPKYSRKPAKWLQRSKIHEMEVPRTGTRLGMAYTHNVLVTKRVFDRISGFDQRFELNGGDDRYFFKQVARLGFKIVSCQEAVTYEIIGEGRQRLSYILMRYFRMGNTEGLIAVYDGTGFIERLRQAWRGLRMAAGNLLLALFALFGITRIKTCVDAVGGVYFGCGILLGLMKYRFDHYFDTSMEQ